MKVEKLIKKLEQLPKGLTVTKVHIETINKYCEPMIIEFEKSIDELRLIRQSSKFNLKFWQSKNK